MLRRCLMILTKMFTNIYNQEKKFQLQQKPSNQRTSKFPPLYSSSPAATPPDAKIAAVNATASGASVSPGSMSSYSAVRVHRAISPSRLRLGHVWISARFIIDTAGIDRTAAVSGKVWFNCCVNPARARACALLRRTFLRPQFLGDIILSDYRGE